MQYNIFIPQANLVKFSKLNLEHGAILSFMRQFLESTHIECHEEYGKKWYWFSSQKILDELPILGIKTKRGFRKKFKPILETKLVERKTECNKTHYYFSSDFFELFSQGKKVPSKTEQLFPTGGNIDSDNHNTNILLPKSNISIKACFNEFLQAYPLQDKQYEERAFKTFKNKMLYSILPNILKAIDHYKETEKVKQGFIFNPHRFLDEDIYKVYLHGIPKSEKQKIPKKQQFENEADCLLEKIEWLDNRWSELSAENKYEIYISNGSNIIREGKDFFSAKEVEAIRRAGGMEILLFSYLANSTKEQIVGLFTNWR